MSDEKQLALVTLKAICASEKAPASAKAMAARTLLEMLGEIGRLQTEKPKESKSLGEMSREELDAEIARLASTMSKPRIRRASVSKRKTPTKTKANGRARLLSKRDAPGPSKRIYPF